MESATAPNPLTALGERLRQARLERGMSQETLAQPEFTKSYVSAVERGKARPSLKALELMARRLGIPLNEFLVAVPPTGSDIDIAALDEDIAYQLDHAKLLITTQRGDDALQLINTAEQEYSDYFDRLSDPTRYRFYRLRALAYLRVGEPGSARRDLDRAMVLAPQLDDSQEVERTRNALGAVFYEQDLPQQALEHHLRCAQAISDGVVKDPTLRLTIYRNLANDYWALKNTSQAIAAYKEALALLEDVNSLEQQAGIYWGISLAYKDEGDLTRAKLYAQKALTIYESAQNQVAVIAMSTNLAEIYIEQGQSAAAEQLLAHAESLLTTTADPALVGAVYTQYAALELQRDQPEQAAAYARRSVEVSAAAYAAHGTPGDQQARANTVRTYARALSVAAGVAERQGDRAEADRLFQQALDLVNQTEYAETSYDITFAYADVLSARGQHQQAALHYRAAAQGRQYRPATD
jgi:tetratricopeptide (TPR) repeat protein